VAEQKRKRRAEQLLEEAGKAEEASVEQLVTVPERATAAG
jgi:hypothetical protein